MYFADRLTEAQQRKNSIAVLGVDPHLDTRQTPGIPAGYTLVRFCAEVIEASADLVVAIKLQLAFFEARGVDGMRALVEVLKLARRLKLLTIADAKRGDIEPVSAAYAQAFLGDGDFGCDAVTVNPYLGEDSVLPFLRIIKRERPDRGLFVCVKTSNPSSGDFQDLPTQNGPVWEEVGKRVDRWGRDFADFVGKSASKLSPAGAVVGATYPKHARRARELMPNAPILVPGYGAQGASAADAVAAARPSNGSGIIVNASRSLMYAYRNRQGLKPGDATRAAAEKMRGELARALSERKSARDQRQPARNGSERLPTGAP